MPAGVGPLSEGDGAADADSGSGSNDGATDGHTVIPGLIDLVEGEFRLAPAPILPSIPDIMRPATPGRRRLVPLALLLPVALQLAGCGLPTDTARVDVESVELLDLAGLVQPLRVALTDAGPLEIEYWADDGPTLRVSSAPARTHEIALTRLRAGRTYAYRAVGGPDAAAGTFTVGSLPDDLAGVTFDAEGTLGVPLVLVHLFDPDRFKGHAIVDAAGEVVWYRRTEDFPFGAVRRDGGTYVLMDRGRGLVEVTTAGEVLAEVAQDTAGRELHHDVIAGADGSLLFIAHDPLEIDGAKVRGEAIWQWSPETGSLEKRWSSWDHLSIDDDRGPRFGGEWLHANALGIGPDDNVLISLHYLNQVVSLSPDLAAIQWRLGGVNATIGLAAADAFTGQHTPSEVAPGRVLLFDNALEAGGPSRIIELEIGGDSAVRRFAWSPPNGNFASAVSSARRLADGGTLVAFGMSAGVFGATGPVEVYEVTADGAVAWRMGVDGTRTLFRAEPWYAVGAEEVVR